MKTGNFIEQYFAKVTQVLETIARESQPAIRKASEAVADAVEKGGLMVLFGSGHSALIARDGACRAGGLAPAIHVHDIADGDAERVEGLAAYFFKRYEFPPSSVLVIISNSGMNPVPIELAGIGRARGMKIVAITSLSHSKAVPSRHSGGKKLYELADIVIDTHGVPGDACVALPGSSLKSGATSTIAGSAIVQAITVQTAALLAERGMTPPVWVSANLPEGDAHNNALLERYRPFLARYQMAFYRKG